MASTVAHDEGTITRREVLNRAALRWVAAAAAGAAGMAAHAVGGASAERKLLERITYFPTEEEVARIGQLGYDAYLEYQLNHTAIDDSGLAPRLANLPLINLEINSLVSQNTTTASSQLTQATFLRATYSKRQLYERMVEFWTDHFNIDLTDQTIYKVVDDREVIRKYALTTFGDLLRASSKSVAMLRYLDNDTNRRGRPNQNYARELMELHTLGVDGGYGQGDVEEVARCFTGWTYWPPSTRREEARAGSFYFNRGLHDLESKYVLSVQFPAGRGIEDGEQVIAMLIAHPSTARYIAKKMTAWLLQYDPPQALVDQVAAVYTATNGDIKAMIRTILARPNVEAAGKKYKRPFHAYVAAMRALGANVTNASSLANTWLSRAGHQPFRWSPPDGYPDRADHWTSLMLNRWNFMASLVTNGVSGVSLDLNRMGTTLTSVSAVLDRIGQVVFAGTMSAETRGILSTFLSAAPLTATRIRDAYGLALSSPEFQWF